MRMWGPFFCILLAACGEAKIETQKDAVVSTSLCADGYVLAFPELENRLAALSWQSKSALSRAPERLRHLPQTDSDPERTLIWEDATKISSAGGPGDIDLKWGESFETVWDNLDSISNRLSLPNPSISLKARLDALNHPTKRREILYLDRSGATAGSGTFVDQVIRAAGGVNIVQTPGWQSPDIEVLMQYNPDVILTSFIDSNYAGVNDRAIRYSGLIRKLKSVPRIDIPGKYWPCAGPGLVDAAEQLSKSLSAL